MIELRMFNFLQEVSVVFGNYSPGLAPWSESCLFKGQNMWVEPW